MINYQEKRLPKVWTYVCLYSLLYHIKWCVWDYLFSPRVPDCLVFLLSPTVNLWTMFQAAQKLGGYELVSIHICCNMFPCLCRGSLSCSFPLSPPFDCFIWLFLSDRSILSPSFLCIVSLFFCALPYLRSVTVFPRSKPLFHKNDAVVLKPPQSGKHMFLCSALVRRKLVKSLIFSQVEVDVCMPRSVFINAPHTH